MCCGAVYTVCVAFRYIFGSNPSKINKSQHLRILVVVAMHIVVVAMSKVSHWSLTLSLVYHLPRISTHNLPVLCCVGGDHPEYLA